MRRKTSHEADSLGDPISTQEYIRRAVEEPGGDDDDFSCNPWLLAVDFVRSAGSLRFSGFGLLDLLFYHLIFFERLQVLNGLGLFSFGYRFSG